MDEVLSCPECLKKDGKFPLYGEIPVGNSQICYCEKCHKVYAVRFDFEKKVGLKHTGQLETWFF